MCSNISTGDDAVELPLRLEHVHVRSHHARDYSSRALTASLSIYSRCEFEFDTAVTCACGNCRAIHSDSEPQPQPSSRIDWSVGDIGMLDGLAQRFLFGLLQRGCRLHVEARRMFAVRPEHMGEERRRHLVSARALASSVDSAMARAAISSANQASLSALPVGKTRRGARTQPVDRGADDDVGQRHARSAVPDHRETKLMCRHSLADPLDLAAAAGRTDWCATGSRHSDRRASAASAPPAAGCRSHRPGSRSAASASPHSLAKAA